MSASVFDNEDERATAISETILWAGEALSLSWEERRMMRAYLEGRRKPADYAALSFKVQQAVARCIGEEAK